MTREMSELRRLLFQEFYYHPRVQDIMTGAKTIVRDLFAHFLERPEDLPAEWSETARAKQKGRVISDFVAGMTDRMAIDTHRSLFDDTPRLR